MAHKYLFLISLLMLIRCSEEESPLRLTDADYFPLKVGMYAEYEVIERIYSEIEGEEIFEYDLKQIVTDSFPNAAGGFTFVLNRFRRDNPLEDYQYVATWSARVEPSQVVVSEENIPFVVLSFPLVEGKQWDGNALNTMGGEELCGNENNTPCDIYSVISDKEHFEFNGDLFEALSVSQNNNEDIIVKQDVRTEQYARGLGLVYKMSSILEYCTVGDCIGKQVIEKGFILEQRLTAIGFE
ncbi:MAG: hypothetical protein RLN86_11045 [Cyclobacteriaceae bacterium]